jgi:hypothetical protein
MWEPRRLTTLWISTARFRHSIAIFYLMKYTWPMMYSPVNFAFRFLTRQQHVLLTFCLGTQFLMENWTRAPHDYKSISFNRKLQPSSKSECLRRFNKISGSFCHEGFVLVTAWASSDYELCALFGYLDAYDTGTFIHSCFVTYAGQRILWRFRCDCTRGVDWWMDLLIIYTHDSELQTLTQRLRRFPHFTNHYTVSLPQPAVSSLVVAW